MVSFKTMMAYLVLVLAFLAVYTNAAVCANTCGSGGCTCPNINVRGSSVSTCCCSVPAGAGLPATSLCVPSSVTVTVPLLGVTLTLPIPASAVCTGLGGTLGTCSTTG